MWAAERCKSAGNPGGLAMGRPLDCPRATSAAGNAPNRRGAAELQTRMRVSPTNASATSTDGHLHLPDRLRRPRHGGRSGHGEHARVRARARDRAVRAERGGDRLAHRRSARGRHRGQAHARAHAGHDPGDPPAEGRRDRRLRRDRADAQALHPEGPPEPLGAPARGRVRALRGDRRGEARRRGGVPVGGRAHRLPDRGADGGGDRSGAAGGRADRLDGRGHRRRHLRGGGHLARRDRRLAVDPRRAATRWTRRSSTTPRRSTSC